MKKTLTFLFFIVFQTAFAQLSAPDGVVTSTTNPSTGNVGIGTSTPTSKLDVNGNLKAGGYLPGAGNINSYSMEVGGSNPLQNNGEATIFFHHHGLVAHQMRYNSGTLFLEAAGNGYGTSNNPNLFIGGNVKAGTYLPGAGNINSYSMEVGGSNPLQNNGEATIFFHHHGLVAHQMRYNSGTLFLEAAGNGYGTSDNPNLIIGGNLGIGTSTPDARLAVNGTIHAREVRVDLSGWPDYVFENTYKLRPLSQIEIFIQQNQHLPEVPSAAEVKKNGVNLGEMDALLLKKIEELTLYMIEMKKENEEIKKENQLMKVEIQQLKIK